MLSWHWHPVNVRNASPQLKAAEARRPRAAKLHVNDRRRVESGMRTPVSLANLGQRLQLVFQRVDLVVQRQSREKLLHLFINVQGLAE